MTNDLRKDFSNIKSKIDFGSYPAEGSLRAQVGACPPPSCRFDFRSSCMISGSPVLRVNSKCKSLSDAWISCRGLINTPRPGPTCTGHFTLPRNRDPRHFPDPRRKPGSRRTRAFGAQALGRTRTAFRTCLLHLPFLLTDSCGQLKAAKFYLACLAKHSPFSSNG